MEIVTIKPFVVPLAAGPVPIPAGTVLNELDYTPSEWARIIEASGGNANGFLSYPNGSIINDAAAECVALRARAGDPENQSQGIMQSAVILQWD